MASLVVVSEDRVSEAVVERIIRQTDPGSDVATRIGRRGLSFIRSKARALNRAAAGMKILVVADRDRAQNCPVEMIGDWLGGPRHPNLVIRFAEMEIESWILADAEPLARYLGVPTSRLPNSPDTLSDPKLTLVILARASRSRRIREDMCPRPGSRVPIGPLCNDRLEAFVHSEWRLARAMPNSPSLGRAAGRVRELIHR